MDNATLTALSPLDGRYAARVEPLRELLSEAAFMRFRVQVEIAWLVALSDAGMPELPPFDAPARAFLARLLEGFGPEQAARIKRIEEVTNHDVKAVEYFLKESVAGQPQLEAAAEFIHFACTSEDINNLAYALMLRHGRDSVLVPALRTLVGRLEALARPLAATPMLARTHGQPASPTTLGKELANIAARLRAQLERFRAVRPLGKINGAVGNFNAHAIAYPEVDWPRAGREFVESLGLGGNPATTPADSISRKAST